MTYSVSAYEGKPAIFDSVARCFVLFGKRSLMEKRCKELNEEARIESELNCKLVTVMQGGFHESLRKEESLRNAGVTTTMRNGYTYWFIANKVVGVTRGPVGKTEAYFLLRHK